jgi:hypothetical protein
MPGPNKESNSSSPVKAATQSKEVQALDYLFMSESPLYPPDYDRDYWIEFLLRLVESNPSDTCLYGKRTDNSYRRIKGKNST